MVNFTYCNTTLEYTKINEEPLFGNVKFHHLGLILSALFGLIAIIMSLYLIYRHATHYLKPWEQKHILRILFMVPVYALVSFLSYYYYLHSIYFEVLRDCYEAFAIASFFWLMCHYIEPDLTGQQNFFRGITPIPWLLPLSWLQKCFGGDRGCLRTPKSGLTWFNIITFCVFQYCVVRVLMTIVAVVSQAFGRYCLDSESPAFAHVWVSAFEATGVTIAMYALIQFYAQLRNYLGEHQPFLKLLSIKLVIFLSFWQSFMISLFVGHEWIKPTKHISSPDLSVGLPSMLLCIEMALFSVLHLWAYPWQVYDVRSSKLVAAESGPSFAPDPLTAYSGGKFGYKAYIDAWNILDIGHAIVYGFRWLFVGRRTRHQDISYQTKKTKTGLGTSNTFRPDSVGNTPGRYQRLDDDREDAFDPRMDSHPPGYDMPEYPKRAGGAGGQQHTEYGRVEDFRDDHDAERDHSAAAAGDLSAQAPIPYSEGGRDAPKSDPLAYRPSLEGFSAQPLGPGASGRPASVSRFHEEEDTAYHGGRAGAAEMPDPSNYGQKR